ncbi:MAG: dihydropteroate synthase [Maribacter sp.]|nr:dihydropteroate synthase [Maribacter sp.]
MTLNFKGNLIDLTQPKVMGILNITPDSFYDGGKYKDHKSILKQVERMLHDGATIIDVGAYSSRPKAIHISEQEELNRILPIVSLLIDEFPDILLSIDTFRSAVASRCLEAGAAMINDISGGSLDADMLSTLAKYKVPFVLMHMKGNPRTMQNETSYDNLLVDIMFYFSERIKSARAAGIIDIIIDPGFGFAKTLEQNYELLQNLQLFNTLELPIMVGLSRKSMIYKVLETKTDEALNGTTALHMVALIQGANMIRVHDVKEAMQCIKLYTQITK